MKKILFWQWNAFMQKGIENGLNKLNVEYEVFHYQLTNWEVDDIFKKKLIEVIEKIGCDVVLSVDYCPIISNVCEEKGLIYISWVYDSPVHIRDISSFANKCNRIYFFDRGQVEAYKAMGYDRVMHLCL